MATCRAGATSGRSAVGSARLQSVGFAHVLWSSGRLGFSSTKSSAAFLLCGMALFRVQAVLSSLFIVRTDASVQKYRNRASGGDILIYT